MTLLGSLIAQCVVATPKRISGLGHKTKDMYQKAMQGKGWLSVMQIAKITGETEQAVLCALRDRLSPKGLVEKNNAKGYKSDPFLWRWKGETKVQ